MDQAEQLRNIVKRQNQPPILSRVITVTSGKGGVGKSSISVNLAIQLSRRGRRVIILDADFGLANVEVMLGIRPQYNLADLMFKGKSLKDIITQGPENIGFISGGSGIQELSNLTRDQIMYLTQKLNELDEIADVVIIDTGAGISDAVLEFVAASSEVLLVVTPEPTSITDAYALLKTLNKKSEFVTENTMIKIVTNRVGTLSEGKEIFSKLSVVISKFLNIKVEYLGAVPQENTVSKAVMQQRAVSIAFPNSRVADAIAMLAQKLEQNENTVQTEKQGIAKLFSNLMWGKRNR